MTLPDFGPLRAELEKRDWLAANLATRRLIGGANPGAPLDSKWLAASGDLIRAVDAAWTEPTAGRFGFTAQRDVWVSIGGGPRLQTFERWKLFYTFGEKVGWKEPGGFWLGSGWSNAAAIIRTVEAPEDPAASPVGLFPFHDVLATFDSDGFSPRDCWGEATWDDWAAVFEML